MNIFNDNNPKYGFLNIILGGNESLIKNILFWIDLIRNNKPVCLIFAEFTSNKSFIWNYLINISNNLITNPNILIDKLTNIMIIYNKISNNPYTIRNLVNLKNNF